MKIVVCDSYTVESLAWLRGQIEARIESVESPYAESERIVDAHGLLIRSTTKVDEGLLRRLPSLRVIATATTGVDHVDLKICAERGIAVFHTPEANAASAAELTLLLMLATVRKAIPAFSSVPSGLWRRGTGRGHILEDKTLGLIGLGRIGSRVARMAGAFGMKVLATDPYIEDSAFAAVGAQKMGLTELLRLSDVISLHVPLTRETRHLVNPATLEFFSSQAVLINTSRGAVVDEQALTQALIEGRLAGAGLDVFETEPPPLSARLLKLPQVVTTPHIGAFTEEAFTGASRLAVERLVGFLKGENVPGRVDLNFTPSPPRI